MNLVDKQDNIAVTADFFNKAFDSAFKLTSELSARNKSRKVEHMNLFISQLCRNISCRNSERKALCNCGFADTGFADKARIVLCSAAKNLNRSVNLVISADNPVNFARISFRSQVGAELAEILSLFLGFILFTPFFLFFSAFAFFGRNGLLGTALLIADSTEILQKRHCSRSSGLKSAVLAEHRLKLLADILQLVL